MEKLFLPVRILDRRWAEKFVEGEIFMRSLSEFGTWNRLINKDDLNLANSFRGDLSEGATKNVSNPNEDDFFKLLPDELKKHIKSGKIMDDADIQYFNLLCFYCLYFNATNNNFEKPSKDIKKFGDTAVIITNMDIFLNRLLERVERNEKYAFLINPIKYYSEEKTKNLNPLFNKSKFYSWQNELRIAVGRLDENNKLSNGNYPIIQSTKPLVLNVGSLRDITITVSTDDFINGVWKASNLFLADSNNDLSLLKIAMQQTNKIMANYQSNKSRYTFDI